MSLHPFPRRLIAGAGFSFGDEGKGRPIPEVVKELRATRSPVSTVANPPHPMMKLSRWMILTGLFAALATMAPAIERLPVEEFARTASAARGRMSPDGQMLAFLREYEGKKTLHILEIDQKNLTRMDLGEATLANDATKEVESFTWIGDKRLVIESSVWGDSFYGVIAANWNGDLAVPISGYEDNQIAVNGYKLFAREVIHRFYDKDQTILMLDRHEGGAGSSSHPDILRVDTSTGTAVTVVKNPGEVVAWATDFNGLVRLGILRHGDSSGAIYREDEKAAWQTILPLQNRKGQMQPLGFDAAGNRMLVAALTKERRWTVLPLDAKGTLGDPLLTDPEYDIVPYSYTPAINGMALAGPIFSRRKQSLIGIRYYTESARVKWFDREFAGYQMVVDKSRPDTVNLMVDESLDGKRTLWFSYSDQNPGVYSLLDSEKRSFTQLARYSSKINPAQMAPTLAVKYSARDGLLIHGYLTAPVGHPPKNLPLVVMPHGGPWVRDIWGYDPLVQLLANRGYAVLQMNYRGSTGYGDELYQNARREIGGKIQDDIEDATRWAITAGVADPKRIAIVGQSYGGYSTLFGLGHNPDLYRCGISIAGVTDWSAFLEDSDVADYKSASRYWREQLGDPGKDKEKLRAASPVNFADKITAPVLIIQGKEDKRVPPDQARRMIAALVKAGRKPENIFISKLGHNYGNEKQRTEIYKAVVAFLEKNLGPGLP